MSQLKNISIDKLYIDSNLKIRDIDKDHVERLENSDVTQWPPLLVVPAHDDKYIVLSGVHRLHAAKALSLLTLECEIIEDDSNENLRLIGYESNRKHGKPLSVQERKEYAKLLHNQFPSLSLREIGKRVNLAHTTIMDMLRSENSGVKHHEQEEQSRDGNLERNVKTLVRVLLDSSLTELAYSSPDVVESELIDVIQQTYDENFREEHITAIENIVSVLTNVADNLSG